MSLLKLKSISKHYGQGANITPVLHDISFTVKSGEFVAIMGPSGSGKSTLMNIIGLLDIASSGSYQLEEKDVSSLTPTEQADERKRKIGFVFQSFNLLGRQTVLDNITLPMVYKGLAKLERERQGHDLLEQVGLTSRGLFKPTQLSGGQKQRVAIARALANRPSLILADEPTGNLDTKTGRKIMELLTKLNKQGNTVIIVTHDQQLASQAHRIIELVDGKVVKDSKPKQPAKKPAKSTTATKKPAKKAGKK